VRDSWADDEVAASGRSQSLSAANRCHWSTQIGEVRRFKSVKVFERQQAQRELDALLDRKPVEGVPTMSLCSVCNFKASRHFHEKFPQTFPPYIKQWAFLSH